VKITILISFLLLLVNVYSEQVDLSNVGIANAQPGDYVIRETGEIVILKQADIDYAKEKLILNSNKIQQNGRQSNQYTTKNQNSNSNGSSPFISITFILIVIAFIIKKYFRKARNNIFSTFYLNSKHYGRKTYIDQNGYRRFIDTDKAVHRWMAEKKLGRNLYPGEVVHHINRNKLDNSIDNLQIFSSQYEHDKEHKDSDWY